MSTSKNQLASKTREHSKLDDIDRSQDAALAGDEFLIEFVDANVPVAEDRSKWKMTAGEHILRATSRDKVEEPAFWVDEHGEQHEIAPHWSIGMEDVKTGEFDYITFQLTPEAERKFKLAVNTRSGRDLGRKIAPHKVEELTVESVCSYLAKFPCKFRYDLSHWIDENGESRTSDKPKIQLWNPEDFQPRHRSKNWTSLR